MKNASDKVRIIKLKHGGAVEDYGDLIDAYEKGIDVREGETLTEYINRIRAPFLFHDCNYYSNNSIILL